jgi:hypothetical protein
MQGEIKYLRIIKSVLSPILFTKKTKLMATLLPSQNGIRIDQVNLI